MTVDAKERVDHTERGTLVAVNERMIDGNALQQRCGLLHDVCVIAHLRPHQR